MLGPPTVCLVKAQPDPGENSTFKLFVRSSFGLVPLNRHLSLFIAPNIKMLIASQRLGCDAAKLHGLLVQC